MYLSKFSLVESALSSNVKSFPIVSTLTIRSKEKPIELVDCSGKDRLPFPVTNRLPERFLCLVACNISAFA